jgi:protein-disulfide isomerase
MLTQRIVLPVLMALSAEAAQQHLIEGAPQSPVRVVIYEDLQCPDCADFRKMMDEQLLPKYAGSVTFEHRDFPLAKHAWARKAAIAARFFEEQKPALGLAYRRYSMTNLRQITLGNFNERLAQFAKDHGIDPATAVAALDDKRLADMVESDYQEGVARGIAKTPTALVNGQPFIEHFTFEEISKTIESELAAAK